MDRETIVIVDGARTPVGSFGGALKDVPAHELGATAVRAAMERSGIEPEEPQEVVMGCIGQLGPDAYNARRVAIAAGCPSAYLPSRSTGCVARDSQRCGRQRWRCGGMGSTSRSPGAMSP